MDIDAKVDIEGTAKGVVADGRLPKIGAKVTVSKGSFLAPKMLPYPVKNINATLNTGDYPNMANGYPDHFAGYAKNDALLDLTALINAYDEAHASVAGYTKLLDDYYPEYMKENKELKLNL